MSEADQRLRLYGIKACDTMKKARTWLDEHGQDDAAKADLDQAQAIELMLAQPSMIKRPVLDLGDRTLIGFKPDLYAAAVAAPN